MKPPTFLCLAVGRATHQIPAVSNALTNFYYQAQSASRRETSEPEGGKRHLALHRPAAGAQLGVEAQAQQLDVFRVLDEITGASGVVTGGKPLGGAGDGAYYGQPAVVVDEVEAELGRRRKTVNKIVTVTAGTEIGIQTGGVIAIGIPTGVMFAPVITALNDHHLENGLKAASDAGAVFAGYIVLPCSAMPMNSTS